MPRFPDGTPAQGVRRFPDGAPAPGAPRFPDGTPAHGVPRFPDGTPAQGVRRFPDGTPAHGVPRFPGGFPGGAPAHGAPRLPDGTPAHGVPRLPDGTPAHGVPRARGGHPEQREGGRGWGELGPRAGGAGGAVPGRTGAPGAGASAGPGGAAGMAARPGVPIPRQRRAPEGGPRQDYLDAFDGGDGLDDVFAPRPRNGAGTHLAAGPAAAATPGAPVAPASTDPVDVTAGRDAGAGADEATAPPTGAPASGGSTKGRTFTGIAAAAVTTVLAVIVAGQVADGHAGTGAESKSATDEARDDAVAGRQAAPSVSAAGRTLTYDQKMNVKYALSPTLKGTGRFEAVPGFAKAPGKGRKYTYRVDVEEGLGLDGALFAEAVQKTLNDDRSWAHDGARTFERVSSGRPDFVITLASPGTTAVWCAKSGLDTTEDNVSCDSAATERVMINAYRWAQGSKTFGDKMYAYRQMLINHEVGHRLGHGHVTCDKDGALAPVMQQQTKFLDHDGIHCLPNPWPYPGS
ncbi:DUF3152 domain-containing protein [Streptomyces spiralis]